MKTDLDNHVFYTWADHLVEISLAFANEAFSKSEGTYELYATWCLGMAEDIYNVLPVPEVAEAALLFARHVRENGYVETDMLSDWH